MPHAHSDQEVIADIQRVAKLLGKNPGDEFSRTEYLQNGANFSRYHIYEGGRDFTELCNAAGYRTKAAIPVSDEQYYERLAEAVRVLGRYPKTSEKKRFGLANACVKAGGLKEFIRRAVAHGYIQDLTPKPVENKTSTLRSQQTFSPVHSELPGQPVPPIPARTKRRNWVRIDIPGFPYAPHDELTVVALFGSLCARGVLPYDVLEMNGGRGIDAICFDRQAKREIRIEVKHILSRTSWNHSLDDLDMVVCWENRWKDFPKNVIELRNYSAPPEANISLQTDR